MPFDPTKTASTVISPDADIAGLIASIGDPDWFRYDIATQTLSVRGIDQDALDQALITVDPISGPRQVKKAIAQAELSSRLEAGLPWLGKVADIDETSTNRMTSSTVAAQLGLLSNGVQWRMKDNSSLTLDAEEMQAMASAAFTYVAGLRAHYWYLLDRITAAIAAENLAAVDPLAGWPTPPASPQP